MRSIRFYHQNKTKSSLLECPRREERHEVKFNLLVLGEFLKIIVSRKDMDWVVKFWDACIIPLQIQCP